MNIFEADYIDLVSEVLAQGQERETRAGMTYSLFGTTLRIPDLQYGNFPILTTRKMRPAGVWGELAAFLTGSQRLDTFKKYGCNYWDANAAAWPPNEGLPLEQMTVGEIYGFQWRRWGGYYDQFEVLIHGLRSNPNSRRHLLTTYNPAKQDEGCLPPCHLLAQFNVRDGRLDCAVYMRSVDLCLGLPSDIILYATLMLVLCKETEFIPGELVFMMGDTHVYQNHVSDFVRHRRQQQWALPKFEYRHRHDKTSYFEPGDISLLDYQHSEPINYDFNT